MGIIHNWQDGLLIKTWLSMQKHKNKKWNQYDMTRENKRKSGCGFPFGAKSELWIINSNLKEKS